MTLPHKVLLYPLFFLFGLAIAWHPAVAATNLTLTPAPVRFGDVAVGQSETLPAVVTNAGTSNFTLSTITGSTGAYTVQHSTLPLTLAPGQSTTLKVTFHPTIAGTDNGMVAFNGGAAYLYLNGWSTSSKSLLPNPPSVNFGNVAAGSTSKSYVTLTNDRNGTVNISSQQMKGTGFSVVGLSTPLTLSPGESFTFTVKFSPPTTGWFSGTVQALNANGQAIISIPLSGNGTPAGQLALSPTSVSFGNVNVGSIASKTGTLTASGASVTVTSASSSNSEFSISGISFPKTISSGQSVSYSVTFTPQSSGSASSRLSFSSTSNSVSEALSGTGLSAAYSVNLTWNPSTSQVSGYNVYRGSISGGPYAKLNSAVDSLTAFTDGSVAASNTYYYVTTAVSSNGQESGYSNQVQVVIP